MRWTSILAIYTLFWWFCLFVVLPWEVRTAEEVGAERVSGAAESAPHEFSVARTALRVTLVSGALFGLYYANYVNGWITADDVDWLR